MDYHDKFNCTARGCPFNTEDTPVAEKWTNVQSKPQPMTTVFVGVALVLFTVSVIITCLFFGRTKLLLYLRKRKIIHAEEKELIKFTVPSIKVTEVYVTKPIDISHHQRSSRTKLLASRQHSISSLSVDDALSDAAHSTPPLSDDDREYLQLNPYHISTRTLSRSHGDLLDGAHESSSECSSVCPDHDEFHRRYTMERFDIKPNELNTSQYSHSEKALDNATKYKSCEHGTICFSVGYNDKTEVLTVVVRKVVDLSPRPARVFADPYVKVTLLPEKSIKYVTNVHQRTLDPVFCQTFLFPLNKAEMRSKSVKFTVCDHLKFFRRNVLGYCVFALSELGPPTLLATQLEIWRSLIDDHPFKGSLGFGGEILVGIRMERELNLFTLSLLQVKDVVPEKEKEHGGVRIKATVMVGQQVLKCKRTKQKKCTHQSSDTVVFNQDIKTHVPADCVNKLNVAISVFVTHSFTKTRLVGRTHIGPYYYASGSGLRHWINMLTSPKQLNTMWHKLK